MTSDGWLVVGFPLHKTSWMQSEYSFPHFIKKKDGNEDEYRNKKIHVRSKDPSRIARQFEKTSSSSKSKKSRDKGVRSSYLLNLATYLI